MYSERFSKALSASGNNIESGIGTYKERSQHKILKYFFELDPAYHEIPVRSYIADICKEDQIYEIQTSGFENLASKLEDFLIDHKVTVVFPAPIAKTVVWTDTETGETYHGRRIKRTKDKYKLLSELIYIIKFIGNEKFNIVVVETEVNDIRLLDGRGSDKKIKSTKIDKIPMGILSIFNISSIDDIKKFTCLETDILYSRADLQTKFQLVRRNLSCAIKALIELGILKEHSRVDKKVFYTTCF